MMDDLVGWFMISVFVVGVIIVIYHRHHRLLHRSGSATNHPIRRLATVPAAIVADGTGSTRFRTYFADRTRIPMPPTIHVYGPT